MHLDPHLDPHLDIASRAVLDRRRTLLAWALGLAAYMALIVAVWQSVKGSADLVKAVQNYPDALKEFFGGADAFDYSTATGYLNVQLFSLMVPLLLVVSAIGFGASTLAGEEQRGLLDLLLAYPVRRRRVALEKALALLLWVVLLAAVVAVTIILAGWAVDLGVDIRFVLAACLGSALLALFHGYVALLVGAITGNRSTAIGVAAALFAAGYLLQALGGLVSWLAPARDVSPFYLANGSVPIRNGVPGVEYAILAGVALVTLLATVVAFERRDLTR